MRARRATRRWTRASRLGIGCDLAARQTQSRSVTVIDIICCYLRKNLYPSDST